MTDREALQIAFNALVEIDRETPYPIAKHAIKCINVAFNTQAQPEQVAMKQGWDVDTLLAQPEQEPVAWAATSKDGVVEALGFNESRRFDTPLYTAPPSKPWVSLTMRDYHEFLNLGTFEAFKAIEAKLKELNT